MGFLEKTPDELWEEEHGPSLGVNKLIVDAMARSKATDNDTTPVEHDWPILEKEK